jgi:hypothetical protein
VAAVIAFFDEQPHLFDLIQRAEVLRGPDQAFPWQKARDGMMRLLVDLFREGNACGEFRIADPDLAVLMLLGGLRGVIRFGKQPRAPDLAEQVVRTFLGGADLAGHSGVKVEPNASARQ